MSQIESINILLSNWMGIIQTCNNNIEKGIEVEFYKSCKEKALAGYEEANNLFYKELSAPEITEEDENGSYHADEEERRELEREELELYNMGNI